jgi:hypothetical protein
VSKCVESADGSHTAWDTCFGAVGPASADTCSPGDDSNCNGIPNQGCDFTPPALVWSLPADGDTGVRAEATITLAFSEPMDREATEQAVALASGVELSFQWNEPGTVLTVAPLAMFEYAEGPFAEFHSLRALEHSLAVGVGAQDLAGNALLGPAMIEFSTLRRIHQSLGLISAEGAYWVTAIGPTSGPCMGDQIWVGYRADHTVGMATFDIAPLPTGVNEIETALLVAHHTTTVGDPIAVFGNLGVEHMSLETGLESVAALDANALRPLGTLSKSAAPGQRSLDVTAALAEDYELRRDREDESEYRFTFPLLESDPEDSHYVTLTCSMFVLETTYLIP